MTGITRRAFLNASALTLAVTGGALVGCSSARSESSSAISSTGAMSGGSDSTQANSTDQASSSTLSSSDVQSWLEVVDLEVKEATDKVHYIESGLLVSGTVVNNREDVAEVGLEVECTRIGEDSYGDEEKEYSFDLSRNNSVIYKGGSSRGFYDLRAGESRDFSFIIDVGNSKDYRYEDISVKAICEEESFDKDDEIYDCGHDIQVEYLGDGENDSIKLSLTNNTGFYLRWAEVACLLKVTEGGEKSWDVESESVNYIKPGSSETVEVSTGDWDRAEYQDTLYVSYYIDPDKS